MVDRRLECLTKLRGVLYSWLLFALAKARRGGASEYGQDGGTRRNAEGNGELSPR